MATGHRAKLPGLRLNAEGKLVPVVKRLNPAAEYARKTARRYKPAGAAVENTGEAPAKKNPRGGPGGKMWDFPTLSSNAYAQLPALPVSDEPGRHFGPALGCLAFGAAKRCGQLAIAEGAARGE